MSDGKPIRRIVTPDRDRLEAFLSVLNIKALERRHPEEVVDVLRHRALPGLIGSLQEALRCMRECGK